MLETNVAEVVAVAGEAPDALLDDFLDQIRPGGRILDLDAGDGRRARYLADAGYRVTALAPTDEAQVLLTGAAAADGLDLVAFRESILDHDPGSQPYDALLCYDLLPRLSRTDNASLLHRIFSWTAHGSLLFLTALHVDDASYDDVSATWERAGLHSFRGPAGEYRTYLARGVVRNLFRGWNTLHHREYMPLIGENGADGPRAGLIELVARRR